MSPLYFWGASIFGKVTASPAATFRELVAIHINIPVTIPVARDAYHVATKDEQKKVKEQLPYLTPAAFKASPSQRVYEQATHCNLIFLDIDVAKDGECPAAPFVSNPKILNQQLAPFAFVAFTTTSSTPEKPRLRVMVSAKGIPVEAYPDAVRTIASRIGLRIITPESRTAVQPMFLPSLFVDQIADLEHPNIAADYDGKAFTVEDIEETDDEAPRVKSYTEKEMAMHGSEALAYLRPPVEEVTLEIAEEALNTIDPDLPYPEWFEMAAALKHQFSPKRAAEAFEIFDAWSATGEKYPGTDATLDQWNSVKPTPAGRAPVTVRSLLHKAVEHGWKSQKVKEACFSSVMEWVTSDERTQVELMSESLKRIAATPLITHTEESALLAAVVKRAKSLHKIELSVSSLRKDLKRLKDSAVAKDNEEKPAAPPWLKGWCYVSSKNEFFRHQTGEKLSPETFNNTYAPKLLPNEEQLEEAGLPCTPANLSKPLMRPQEYALNFHQIMVVYDYEYNPAKPNKLFTRTEGRYYVNTYRKSYPEASSEGAAKAEKIFRSHLELLVAEDEYRTHILDWLAYNVQYPGRKIRHAILIQGGEGCGKSYLFDALKVVLGKTNVRKVNKATLDKGWTEWAVGSQVVAVEEIRVVGHNRYDVMNTLKELVTNDDVPINERNTSTKTAPNITNYLLFSNFHDALALSEGDRRYFVLKSPLQTKSQIVHLEKTGHFQRIFAMLEEHASGLRHFFENYEISDAFSADAQAPRTIYADQIIDDTCDEVARTIKQVIAESTDPLIQKDAVASTALANRLIYEGIKKPTESHIASVLRNLGFEKVGRYQTHKPEDDLEETRQYIWIHATKARQKIDWGHMIRTRVQQSKLLEGL